MALIPPFPETAAPLLVNQLNQPKRRLETVGKNNLDLLLVDRRIGLIKKLHEQILVEVMDGIEGMDPGALSFRIWF